MVAATVKKTSRKVRYKGARDRGGADVRAHGLADFLGQHFDRRSSVSSWFPTGQVKFATSESKVDAEEVPELGGWKTSSDNVAVAFVPAPGGE